MYLALFKNPQNSELALLYNGVCCVCVFVCLFIAWNIDGWQWEEPVQEYIETKLNLRSF